jgi:hypothetical protein
MMTCPLGPVPSAPHPANSTTTSLSANGATSTPASTAPSCTPSLRGVAIDRSARLRRYVEAWKVPLRRRPPSHSATHSGETWSVSATCASDRVLRGACAAGCCSGTPGSSGIRILVHRKFSSCCVFHQYRSRMGRVPHDAGGETGMGGRTTHRGTGPQHQPYVPAIPTVGSRPTVANAPTVGALAGSAMNEGVSKTG